jgi:hypothetical protein
MLSTSFNTDWLEDTGRRLAQRQIEPNQAELDIFTQPLVLEFIPLQPLDGVRQLRK